MRALERDTTMNARQKLAVALTATLCTVAGIAAAQTISTSSIKPPPLKAVASSTAITAVAATGACGGKVSVAVTIQGGSLGGTGTIVFGTSARFTAAYKVGANASITVTVPTTATVSCGTTGATVPSGSVWLEPSVGGSDAMMWVVSPRAVTYESVKQPIPG